MTQFLPKSRFSGPEHFSDILSVRSAVCNQISVEFAGDWAGEAPPEENWIKDSHSQKVVARRSQSTVNKTFVIKLLPAIQRLHK